jgi:hypothetical protein
MLIVILFDGVNISLVGYRLMIPNSKLDAHLHESKTAKPANRRQTLPVRTYSLQAWEPGVPAHDASPAWPKRSQ